MVRYLLVTIEYEPFAHLGRPHSISYNAVKELFGSFSNVKFAAQVWHSCLHIIEICSPSWRNVVTNGTNKSAFLLASSVEALEAWVEGECVCNVQRLGGQGAVLAGQVIKWNDYPAQSGRTPPFDLEGEITLQLQVGNRAEPVAQRPATQVPGQVPGYTHQGIPNNFTR